MDKRVEFSFQLEIPHGEKSTNTGMPSYSLDYYKNDYDVIRHQGQNDCIGIFESLHTVLHITKLKIAFV